MASAISAGRFSIRQAPFVGGFRPRHEEKSGCRDQVRLPQRSGGRSGRPYERLSPALWHLAPRRGGYPLPRYRPRPARPGRRYTQSCLSVVMLVMRSAVAASPCSTFYVLVVYSTTTSEVLHEAAATPGAVASAATKLLVFSRRPVRSPSAAGS